MSPATTAPTRRARSTDAERMTPLDDALATGRWVLACVAALAVVGLVTAVSAAPPGEAWVTLGMHAVHLSLGIAAFLATYSLHPDTVRRCAPVAVALLFLLLFAMLLTPLGYESHNARRWLRIGPLSLQPSLFYQLVWPVVASSWVARDPLRLRSLREMSKLAGLFLLCMLPVFLQPDLGSVMILLVVTGMAFLFAGAPRKALLILIPAMILAVWVATLLFPHVAERLNWLHEESYQVTQGRAAFERGGVLGQGPGQGVMKFGHVPEGETDFVMPLIAEEWGLAGTLGVWLLFGAFTLLGFRTARRARTRYGIVLMATATVMVSFQAAYNLGMVTGLLPVKGLPLPFVSRGGSSVLALSALLGAALRAAQAERRARVPATELLS